MAEDLGDRTEDATPKRLAEAREEGNIAKSQDLAGVLLLLVGTLGLWATATTMLGQGQRLLHHTLLLDTLGSPLRLDTIDQTLGYIGTAAVQLGAPIILLAWAGAILSQVVQVGWIFSTKAARPNFKKLNPWTGLKRIVGTAALVKSGLDAVRVAIVIAIAGFTISQYAESILALPYFTSMEGWLLLGSMMLNLALRVLAALLMLGIIDYMYQRWKHHNDLKMTKQQVKDEMKQSEGDPEVKRRRMRMQREIAQQRVASAVPKADVIVTNPEHISVAIQYDSARMHAPRVVAKGADYLAMRIRYIAMQHDIPIVERKPLARALYRQVAVNQEIPPEFYKAIAEILAYVYRLNGRMASASQE